MEEQLFRLPAALGLALQHDPVRGRHLVATRAFRAGDLVLAQEPFAAVLQDGQVAARCDHCFEARPGLQRCAKSQFARYCSRAHQKAAWDQGFKQESAALAALAQHRQPPPSATVRLAARIAWRAKRERDAQQATAGDRDKTLAVPAAAAGGGSWSGTWPAPGGTWAQVVALEHHWERLPAATQLTFAQVAVACRQYVTAALPPPAPPQPPQQQHDDVAALARDVGAGRPAAAPHPPPAPLTAPPAPGAASTTWAGIALDEADGLPSVRGFALLVARLAANSHTLCDEELRAVGAGLYPLAAMANHACRPSCLQSFVGSTMCFRALRDLAPGDEVTISYTDLAAPLQERREALWEAYRFDLLHAPPPPPSPAPPHATNGHHTPSTAPQQHPNGSAAAGGGDDHEWRRLPAAQALRPAPLRSDVWKAASGAAWEAAPASGDGASPPPAPTHPPPSSWGGQSPPQGLDGLPPSMREPAASLLAMASAGGGSKAAPSVVLLREYAWRAGGADGAAAAALPPWPCEEVGGRDAALTELQWRGAADGGGAGAPRQRQGPGAFARLAGGAQAQLRELTSLEDEATAHLSFASLGLGEDEEGEEGEEGVRPQGAGATAAAALALAGHHQAAAEAAAGSRWGGATSASASSSAALWCEVDVWGPWVATSGGGADGVGTGAARAAGGQHGPRLCARTLALQLSCALGALRRTERDLNGGAAAAQQQQPAAAAAAALAALSSALRRVDGMPVPLIDGVGGAGQEEAAVVVRLGPAHGLRRRLLEVALRAAIESGAWGEALELAKGLRAAYDAALGGGGGRQHGSAGHPSAVRALHDASVAKLAALQGELRLAAEAAERALGVLSVTHAGGAWGPAGSALCSEVARVQWESVEELEQQQQQQQRR